MPKLSPRISGSLLKALAAGVVPRIGLEHIAIGREKEIKALHQDLENIGVGGASFRIISGRYGSGKSFMLQLIRNQAMEQGFVVADADLSTEHRLSGTKNIALATYRELMKNIATKTNPSGGAIALILEKWLSSILNQVAQATNQRPGDDLFDQQVEIKIREVVDNLEGLVHGFDFANVIITYWRGYREDNQEKKEAALRWLRGEFNNKTGAKNSPLKISIIIDDNTWYDYLKLWARFVAEIGYRGLIIFLDEAVYLYKIPHSRSRQSNYDKLLAMFNDTMQGKAENLGIIVGGTPQFIEDKHRGLYSDEAWRTRLATSRFLRPGLQDNSAPVISLEPLTTEELSQLLQRLTEIHAKHHKSKKLLNSRQIQDFKQEINNRLGFEQLSTPRQVIRDFVSILNILQQNPQITLTQLLQSSDLFQNSKQDNKAVKISSDFAEFTL